jgi:hypothetical protein
MQVHIFGAEPGLLQIRAGTNLVVVLDHSPQGRGDPRFTSNFHRRKALFVSRMLSIALRPNLRRAET